LHVIVEETPRLESDIELVVATRRGPRTRRKRGASSERTADVVIIAESGVDGPALDERLLDNPRVKLLVLTADGRQAHLFQATRLIELSSQRLADAIRSAAQPHLD
jgi:hypothetical protein